MATDRPASPSIFLSHNQVDKPFVRRVHKKLVEVGIRTWLDEGEILPGQSLIDKIEQGLADMDYLGVFLSSNSIKSPWVRKELNVVLTQEIQGNSIRIIPIVVGTLGDSEIPAFLADRYYIDFRNPAPFEKGIHELRMVLSDAYSEYLSKTIEDIESPDQFSVGFAALRALLIDGSDDPEELAKYLHRYQVLKSVGVDLKQFKEFVEGRDDESAIERLCAVLRKDLPYPLWPYLASPDVIRGIFRAMGAI